MHHKEQFPESPFRTISLAVVATLVMAVAIVPAWAQNSVPPTAVQAAKMPQFASRLAHSAKQPASYNSSVLARARAYFRPLQPNDIYDNGPINGTTDAWTINFGFVVSDSFAIANNNTTVTGMSFGAWLLEGDTLNSAELSITSGINGGTSYFDQTVNFTQSNCSLNQYGYNICTETAAFNGPTLNAGNYWVNLQNASTADGEPIYWDENSGVGCQSPGCPSQADESSVGTIPSEAFTILGSATTTYPPPTCFNGGVEVLHNFTSQEGGGEGDMGDGVTIDNAGNLYGITNSGGNNSAGLAYKLDRWADWTLDSLYSFAGGYSGRSPNGVIVGPNGTLYGGALGGNQSYGLVFNLTPSPTACLSAPCSWNENILYQFTGNTDAEAGTVSAFDAAGNLYGISSYGGAYGYGAVFELTPSSAGWTEQILYSFTGASDGAYTSSLLVGQDGNLYGTASGGGAYGSGVVFQLTPSGNGWTESVLYSFQGTGIDGQEPSYLGQDGAGNLYGIAFWYYDGSDAPIFTLQKSGGGWVFSEYLIHHNYSDIEMAGNLIVDAAGNLYGTEGGGQGCSGGKCNGTPDQNYVFADIFQASYGSGGWQYRDVVYFNYQYFNAGGPLALDAQGNLYGATWACGTNNLGTIWELLP
ncbi:MAG: choice-of-anchor tandem repeat GloVer-containing protein [Candidatus Korobacteraceae bacterium]|jgi:uncharacterized repeat protein (TIGR03803 family)